MSSSSSFGCKSIRPLTGRFPASLAVWEESNLPFSVVLTPLAEEEESDNEDGTDVAVDRNQHSFLHADKLTGVAKCLHCGAPHPGKDTHFQPYRNRGVGNSGAPPFLLCYLCGNTSSTALPEQQQGRPEEALLQEVLDSVERIEIPQVNTNLPSANYSDRATNTFALPLRLPKSSSSNNKGDNNAKNNRIYSVPASHCPLVWFVVLDGSIGARTTTTRRSYWHAVSKLLLQTLETCPAHVRVSLLVAGNHKQKQTTQRQKQTRKNDKATSPSSSNTVFVPQLSVYHTTSPLPHLETYKPDDYDENGDVDNDSIRQDLLEAIRDSLVPADRNHKVHLQAAVRSLMDYPTAVNGGHDLSSLGENENESAKNQGSGMPLGWTVETVLDTLACYCHHGGQRLTHQHHRVSTGTSNDPQANIDNNSNYYDNLLPYAGGKVTVLLAGRPAGVPSPAPEASATAATGTTVSSSFSSMGKDATNQSSSWVGPGGCGGRLPSESGQRFAAATAAFAALQLQQQQQEAASTTATATTSGNNDNYNDNNVVERDVEAGATNTPFDINTNNDTSNRVVDDSSPFGGVDPSNLDVKHLDEHYSQGEVYGGSSLAPDQYFASLGRQCAAAALGVDLFLLVDASTDAEQQQQQQQSQQMSWIQPLIQPPPVQDYRTNFGLPYFSSLAVRSGTPGPLLFDYSSCGSGGCLSEDWLRFERELLARTPWQPGRAFGGELRMRLSPGFAVDTAPGVGSSSAPVGRRSWALGSGRRSRKTKSTVPPPVLVEHYTESGVQGPACAADEGASDPLWCLGTCDQFTSLTVDLAIQHAVIPDRFDVEGFGTVALKPVVQTCFAYTTIVKEVIEAEESGGGDGEYRYYTVRQMRISSVPVPLARTVESMYDSLDTEALAVTLFHKLTLSSLQYGLEEAADTAQDWLISLLQCAYRSAQAQDQVQQRAQERGIREEALPFYRGERLLDCVDDSGELSSEEILLGQGHELLKPIPLMVYLLLQSDALRPLSLHSNSGIYQNQAPTIDLRWAAILQMSSMTPSALTRCIAPRLQLWMGATEDENNGSSGNTKGDHDDDKLIEDLLDLRVEALRSAIMDFRANVATADDSRSLLFLDTPDQIAVIDARYVCEDVKSSSENNTEEENSEEDEEEEEPPSWWSFMSSKPKTTKRTDLAVEKEEKTVDSNDTGTSCHEDSICPALANAIVMAANSYRVRPVITYELGGDDDSGHRYDQKHRHESAAIRLIDVLSEDAPLVVKSNDSGDADEEVWTSFENFLQWKRYIAEVVLEELRNEDDASKTVKG